MGDGHFSSDGIEGNPEKHAIFVSNGIELVLDLFDETGWGIVAIWNRDLEEMYVANVIGCIESEHGILLGPGEVIEADRDLDGGYAGFDHVSIRMSEGIEEVCGRLLCVFSEGGVNVDEMFSQII